MFSILCSIQMRLYTMVLHVCVAIVMLSTIGNQDVTLSKAKYDLHSRLVLVLLLLLTLLSLQLLLVLLCHWCSYMH